MIERMEGFFKIPAGTPLHNINMVMPGSPSIGRIEIAQYVGFPGSSQRYRAVPPNLGLLSASLETTDLAETGKLLRAIGAEPVGEAVEVDLPGSGAVRARSCMDGSRRRGAGVLPDALIAGLPAADTKEGAAPAGRPLLASCRPSGRHDRQRHRARGYLGGRHRVAGGRWPPTFSSSTGYVLLADRHRQRAARVVVAARGTIDGAGTSPSGALAPAAPARIRLRRGLEQRLRVRVQRRALQLRPGPISTIRPRYITAIRSDTYETMPGRG